MEIAMWVVLGSMAVDFLIGLFKSLTGGKLSHEPVLGYLKDIVYYVLPLFLLAGISIMDSTGWIVLAAYYVGAFAVFVKYVMDIKAKL
jgi:predicted lysophospholipase L1 biosynthesis ABC-type transport system permease subunit